MAKGYNDKKLNQVMEMVNPSPEKKEVEFTNSRGIKVTLRAMSPFIVQLATESIERPEIPTYVTEIEGGGSETVFHDEKSILDPKTSEEDKQAWAEYQIALREADRKSSEIMMNVILIESVDVAIDDIPRWIHKQKMMGITVPENEDERLLLYKKEYVIACPADMEEITKIVMTLTGVSREEIDIAKKSFQGPVEPDPQEGDGKVS